MKTATLNGRSNERHSHPRGSSDKAAALEIGEIIKNAFIESHTKRARSVFLGSHDFPEILDTSLGRARCEMLFTCLPRFVESRGGRIVAEMRLAFESVEQPRYANVRVGETDARVLFEGSAFIELPDCRVIVTTEAHHNNQRLVSVVSSGSPERFNTDWEEYTRQHNHLRGRWIHANGKPVREQKSGTWEDIVLSQALTQEIRTHATGFLNRLDWLRASGLKLRRGIILHGVPGSGKSLLCRVIASNVTATTIWCSPQDLESSWAVAEMMRMARLLSPTLIVLEDLDLFGAERDGRNGEVLGELMNQMDGLSKNDGILTVATTNHLHAVEKALQNRPGRFDRSIEVAAPDAACRLRLLIRLLRHKATELELREIVAATDGMTGAQLEEIVATAHLQTFALEKDSISRQSLVSAVQLAASEFRSGARRAIGFA